MKRDVNRPRRPMMLALLLPMLLATAMPAPRADEVCADGRTTLEAVINAHLATEREGGQGKLWNKLFRAPGGAEVFYLAFEKSVPSAVYVFQDGCMVSSVRNLDRDAMLKALGVDDPASAFGDRGI